MSNPTNDAVIGTYVSRGDDFLQLKSASGSILGWVDSNATLQGNLLPNSGGGGTSGVQVRQTTVTSADLLGLVTTPKTLLGAPGASSGYFVIAAMVQYIPGTTGYTQNNALDQFLNICTLQTYTDANSNAEWENALSIQFPITSPYGSGNYGNFLSFNTPTNFNFDMKSTRAGIFVAYPSVNFAFGSLQFASTTEIKNSALILGLSQGQSAASGNLTLGNGSLLVTLAYATVAIG